MQIFVKTPAGSTITLDVDGSYTIKVTAGGERVDREPLRVALRFDSQVVGELKITAPAAKPIATTITARLVGGKTRGMWMRWPQPCVRPMRRWGWPPPGSR